MSGSVDSKRQARFKRNQEFLKSSFDLRFPDYSRYPYQVREIFEYFKGLIHKEDLQKFNRGQLFKENIINVYFKILEKMHQVMQSTNQLQGTTPGGARGSSALYNSTTVFGTQDKIMYYNTNFTRKLNNPNYLKDCI